MTMLHAPASDQCPARGRVRVAIVDDAPSTRRFLHAVMASAPSFEVVDEVGTGQEAVTMVDKVRPDVVLLDLSLPDMDGSVVLRQIKRTAPATKVVILSNGARQAELSLVDAGAAGFIEKGLPPLDLLERISELLLVPSDQPGESVSEFLDSTRTFVPAAVVLGADPALLHDVTPVLADCGVQVVTVVVAHCDVIGALQSALYMTRPAVVIVGDEGGPTGELVACAQLQSPRTPIVIYSSERVNQPLHEGGARVVARPDRQLLERTVRDVLAGRDAR